MQFYAPFVMKRNWKRLGSGRKDRQKFFCADAGLPAFPQKHLQRSFFDCKIKSKAAPEATKPP
jgi:hypothetical protein